MQQGAERFGAETELAEVYSMDLNADPKVIDTSEGVYYGRTVVYAAGAGPRELGIPGEKELVGRGINYCAACDGMFYRGKTVAIVGGGNSAVADALILARIAKKVILIHRRDTLRAERIYHAQLEKMENVEFRWDSEIVELLSGEKLDGIRIRNIKTGEISEEEIDGLFVSIGRRPNTELVKNQLQLDRSGYIQADESTKASVPGVFAVGDVRTKALRQIVTAAADGAVAVHFAEEYLIAKH